MSIQSKAVVCRELNAPVIVETISVERPQAGEVLVEMKACGVCHSDLSATNGTIGFPLPLVLGHEGAGIVAEIGAGVTGFAPGDHVLTSFVSMCGRCRFCQISEVTGETAGQTQHAGFFIADIDHFCCGDAFFFCQEAYDTGVNVTGSGTHDQTLQRSQTHGSIHGFSPLDCRNGCTVAQMTNNDL